MKEIGSVGFMDKPVPRPGPNDAIVQTTRALICTSDSHTVGAGIGPRKNLTLGHEAVGIVHEGQPASPGRVLVTIGRAARRMEVLQQQGRGFRRVLPRE